MKHYVKKIFPLEEDAFFFLPVTYAPPLPLVLILHAALSEPNDRAHLLFRPNASTGNPTFMIKLGAEVITSGKKKKKNGCHPSKLLKRGCSTSGQDRLVANLYKRLQQARFVCGTDRVK